MGDKPVFYAGDDPFRFDEGYGTPRGLCSKECWSSGPDGLLPWVWYNCPQPMYGTPPSAKAELVGAPPVAGRASL